MIKQAEILVLGGTHGDEPFGIELVKSLTENPIPNVEALIANERAAAIGKRFIHTNLNCEILDDTTYEARRVRELIGQCARFSLILDFHNAMDEVRQEIYLPHLTNKAKAPARWLLAHSGIQHALTLPDPSPFYRRLSPPTLLIELGMPNNNYSQWEDGQLQRWRRIISDMAKTGLSNLDAPLEPMTSFMELVLEPSRKEAEHANLDRLPELKPYDTLPLSAQRALSLPDGNRYRVLSSHYQNFSPIDPNTGERTGWGSITRDINPFL